MHAPAAPGSLMRSLRLGGHKPGLYRLARRGCELYSVQILSGGSWGRIKVMDGHERELWAQPSTFTGSFWLGAWADGGLLVEVSSRDYAPNLTINWREQDQRLV